jgi:hypothetical protein
MIHALDARRFITRLQMSICAQTWEAARAGLVQRHLGENNAMMLRKPTACSSLRRRAIAECFNSMY